MDEDNTIYVYKVVREDLKTGQRSKRAKRCGRCAPDLKIGGLYLDLGFGFPGAQRVVSMGIENYD